MPAISRGFINKMRSIAGVPDAEIARMQSVWEAEQARLQAESDREPWYSSVWNDTGLKPATIAVAAYLGGQALLSAPGGFVGEATATVSPAAAAPADAIEAIAQLTAGNGMTATEAAAVKGFASTEGYLASINPAWVAPAAGVWNTVTAGIKEFVKPATKIAETVASIGISKAIGDAQVGSITRTTDAQIAAQRNVALSNIPASALAANPSLLTTPTSYSPGAATYSNTPAGQTGVSLPSLTSPISLTVFGLIIAILFFIGMRHGR
jgi:hypothetical protein